MDDGMKNRPTLFDIYTYDQVTNAMTVPLQVGTYNELYNPIDPSPALTRDLSQQVLDYLDQCSEEIDEMYKIRLTIEITGEERNATLEAQCGHSIKNFYQHEIAITQNRIKRTRKAAFKHLLVSLACLTVYVVSYQFVLNGLFFDVIKEAILIGGWVFMWESVTHNFIQVAPIQDEIKRCQRLIDAPVVFLYSSVLP